MADRCKLSSAIVADSVERSYLLKVDGYSSAKERFKTGECLASPLLSLKGHDWVLRYYPNGKSEEGGARYISLVVECSDPKDDLPVPPISLRHRAGRRAVPPYVVNASYTEPFSSASGLSSYHLFLIDKTKLEQSRDIKDDCFSIRCVLTLSERETAGNRFVFVPPSDMHLHFGSLLESMDGADVTFLVSGERFSAHRLVLAARSSVFRAELLGAMRESAGGPIEIHEMEADVFRCLIHFIYTDSVPDLQMASNHGEAHLQMASHLLVAADRYNIERLKLICEHKLCSHIDASMVATSLALAEQHCCNGLKEACLQFLASPSNLEAMMASDGYKHLKSSCPSALKELIARLLPANMKAAKDIVMTL